MMDDNETIGLPADLPADAPVDARLDRQQTYQQFHLGVYISLVTIIGGATILERQKVEGLIYLAWFMIPIVFFLMLAGMCGGFVAAKIPEFRNYDRFLKTKIGFQWPWSSKPLIKLYPKTWESFEHLCFWVSIILFFIFGCVYWVKIN